MKTGLRYAILGDIHSNWEALSAVLDDAEREGVDTYVCVGDLVGYNPDPARCLDRLRGLACVSVRGNHDHYCAGRAGKRALASHAAIAVDWTRRRLSREQIAYLGDLQMTARCGDFTVVHNTLHISADWEYVFTERDAEESMRNQLDAVCFHGHTHLPVVFEQTGRVVRRAYRKLKLKSGRKYFINVGSVGQPRDRDPRAAYVIYDTAAAEIELRRIAYDVKVTQSKIREAGLPEWLAFRLGFGM